MINDLIKCMLNYAFNNNIGFELVNLEPDMQSFTIKSSNLIIINLNWHNRKELPFQIAHEISHIMNNDNLILYKAKSCKYKLSYEHNADLMALNILIPVYLDQVEYTTNNIYPLMEQLAIPKVLINESKEIAYKYIQKDC
ncbi:ImmA/IrrE family metallo-endopeptidase [Apilactobacillus timberlakei]|uniref:ImmA/IrrE family metallo-endopeptidase n=1 Tax=Apilactobacillus timberlakei TaxID=2008380 RepID=UPI00112E3D4E|nr:ImmA/IrrE family metallo-endopeptidase [Apilactobacillus timberlakei]TPR19956.1 ImmA/IrrE family metallo-endopeptidase [Apilactobacillus timberlakei]TPR21674.1 ImmA/IrrE family metallo-endopeptidase [Apilactobacillus timberlakei]TPR22920.1 ImmA/IrrE family metallo-endopeptidase [Apilactobacillus timberlakei]